jgi:hypothetical protein
MNSNALHLAIALVSTGGGAQPDADERPDVAPP